MVLRPLFFSSLLVSEGLLPTVNQIIKLVNLNMLLMAAVSEMVLVEQVWCGGLLSSKISGPDLKWSSSLFPYPGYLSSPLSCSLPMCFGDPVEGRSFQFLVPSTVSLQRLGHN